MGHVKIWTDHHPQAILKHIWETSRNAEFFFLKNYPLAQQKPFFPNQRVPPLDFQKRFLQCRGVIFQKKKFCVFGSLSNMSKNGLRMVVCLNFDITHLSD